MALHPTVQAKAQAQLDSVVGMDRLPEIDDISSLPYIKAVLMEIMRWRPVVPLSMCHPWLIPRKRTLIELILIATAHAISEDDEYNGYFIPKGATIVPNAW